MNVSTSWAKMECMAQAMEKFNMQYRHKGFTPFWVESNGPKVWLWTFKCVDRNENPWSITIDIHDMDQNKVECDA